MGREALRPIKMSMAASASIHQNVSQGYYNISPEGERTYVPYAKSEFGEIHSFISPRIDTYKKMKWNKTKDWKDQSKAKKSKWKSTAVFSGMNTVSK